MRWGGNGFRPLNAGVADIWSGNYNLGDPLPAPANIQKGDYWIISVAGTIAGISGSTILTVGDILMATADSAALAADFAGIETTESL